MLTERQAWKELTAHHQKVRKVQPGTRVGAMSDSPRSGGRRGYMGEPNPRLFPSYPDLT